MRRVSEEKKVPKKPKAPAEFLSETQIRAEVKAPSGGYFFFGEEDYLKRHYVEQMRLAALADSPIPEMNEIALDEESYTPETLSDAISAFPLMGSHRFVSLRLPALPEKKEGELDRLTEDVDYRRFADRYERAFSADGGEFRLLLDLCCGTGSLSLEMSKRGYEMIAADGSESMLMQAREKCADLPVPPLFLLQDAAALDLYGTVDAAFCSLEGINYLSPATLDRLLGRLFLFIRPGGLFLFDLRTPDYLKGLDGDTFVDEDDDVFCLWRADFDDELGALVYGMDLFSREGGLWRRSREEHVEYAHSPAFLSGLLEKHGFTDLKLEEEDDRLHVQCRRSAR